MISWVKQRLFCVWRKHSDTFPVLIPYIIELVTKVWLGDLMPIPFWFEATCFHSAPLCQSLSSYMKRIQHPGNIIEGNCLEPLRKLGWSTSFLQERAGGPGKEHRICAVGGRVVIPNKWEFILQSPWENEEWDMWEVEFGSILLVYNSNHISSNGQPGFKLRFVLHQTIYTWKSSHIHIYMY